MQTLVTNQQISHFAQFGWIEFEGFLTLDECAFIRSAAMDVVAKRLKTDLKKLSRHDLYPHGRDLWRDHPALKKFICKERFTSTISSLTNKSILQLACDQWIPSNKILEPLHLTDHFSFQNLISGALLILDGPLAGNARFFSPERLPMVSDTQMLIAYGCPQSVYVHNPLDPCNCLMKQYGYSFGDHLSADQNPICKNHS